MKEDVKKNNDVAIVNKIGHPVFKGLTFPFNYEDFISEDF
jgi:hypothetical protein